VAKNAALVPSNIRAAKAQLISDKKSLFDTVPLLNRFSWLRSRFEGKQAGKKHGKRVVNPGNGFASVAYDSLRKQGTKTRPNSEVAFCSTWNRNSY